MNQPDALRDATPFPDADMFPYPRLCVPTIKGGSTYPRYQVGHVEYDYYEKERVSIEGGKEHLVWRKIQ